MKVIHIVVFFLAAFVGCSEAKCNRDKDCRTLEYCVLPARACVTRLEAGYRCNRDRQCASNRCTGKGKCKSIARRIAGGIIAAIAVAALVLLVIIACVTFCCCRVMKKRKERNAEATPTAQA